nr:PREDICTED: interferon alpha-F-like isoform X2 [Lepisosteus oculatus]
MTLNGLFTRVCILLLAVSTLTLGCINHRIQVNYIEKSLSLLETMGSKVPEQCLEESAEMHMNPNRVISKRWKKGETAQNVKDVFELASELFKVSPGSVSWDTGKLKEFQELLHTQAAEFAKCAPKLKMNNAAWRTKTRVYFEKLKKAVGSENNLCAWEAARSQMRTILLRVFHLKLRR